MEAQDPTVGRSRGEGIAEERRAAMDELAIAQDRPFIPLLPNLIATAAGFLSLLAAPWICLKIHEWILEDEIVSDRVSIWLTVMSMEDSAVIAVIGSLLFLAIGAMLQAWDHWRPFSPRWPVWLSFPIAGTTIIPETLLRGGTVLSSSILAVAVAVSFVIHWLTVAGLREEMD